MFTSPLKEPDLEDLYLVISGDRVQTLHNGSPVWVVVTRNDHARRRMAGQMFSNEVNEFSWSSIQRVEVEE